MPDDSAQHTVAFAPLDPAKFTDPDTTAKGEARAVVELARLETVWLNTGSLCNIECGHCYMESGPKKDDLAYLSLGEAERFFDEIAGENLGATEIGITGGEPFMNPDIIAILGAALGRGLRVLVLTNAMKPLWHQRVALAKLNARFGNALRLRVSVDHFLEARHEMERGEKTWAPMMRGFRWLVGEGFQIDVAGRTFWDEDEGEMRKGYQMLFDDIGLALDAQDPAHLVLFPEMDVRADVPEITTACWGILGVRPDSMMCATARMVVHRKGASRATVVPCTLLPYDENFDMGETLKGALGAVKLNHPHCAKFCVLGGASCSSG